MNIVDLSHLLNNNTPVYPGTEQPIFEQANTIVDNGFAETKISMYSHTGTHMDAPSHMIAGAKSLDALDPSTFYGSAVCIDCREVSNASISKEHLLPFSYIIEKVDFVVLRTGWSKKWTKTEYFKGFPTLSLSACEWLVGFKLKGIGIDTISIDKMGSYTMENHLVLLNKGLVIIENLNNLKALGTAIFTFSCFPIKYENADGSPVRAVAIMNDRD